MEGSKGVKERENALLFLLVFLCHAWPQSMLKNTLHHYQSLCIFQIHKAKTCCPFCFCFYLSLHFQFNIHYLASSCIKVCGQILTYSSHPVFIFTTFHHHFIKFLFQSYYYTFDFCCCLVFMMVVNDYIFTCFTVIFFEYVLSLQHLVTYKIIN